MCISTAFASRKSISDACFKIRRMAPITSRLRANSTIRARSGSASSGNLKEARQRRHYPAVVVVAGRVRLGPNTATGQFIAVVHCNLNFKLTCFRMLSTMMFNEAARGRVAAGAGYSWGFEQWSAAGSPPGSVRLGRMNRWCRCAQPPATGWYPSGMQTAALTNEQTI